MKYKVSRDLPKLAMMYNTLRPSELARIILKEKGKAVSPESITQWFKRHPSEHSQLSEAIKNRSSEKKLREIPEDYAKLVTYNYGTTQIIDLETLEIAKKKLALVEEDIRIGICKKTNLNIISRPVSPRRKRSII